MPKRFTGPVNRRTPCKYHSKNRGLHQQERRRRFACLAFESGRGIVVRTYLVRDDASEAATETDTETTTGAATASSTLGRPSSSGRTKGRRREAQPENSESNGQSPRKSQKG